MSFYSTTSYPLLPTENASLVISFCNLLQNFGKELAPTTFAESIAGDTGAVLDWSSIVRYDSEIFTVTTGETGTWPTSKNAIVKFRIIGSDGQPKDHYCLVFDPANQTIIDSEDGRIKSPGVYGQPTAWVSYFYVPPVVETVPEPEIPVAKDNQTYIVLKGGEFTSTIARKLNMNEKDICEHNDIRPGTVAEYTALHLPYPLEQKKDDTITYTIYDHVKTYHVVRSEGARKYSFGNAKQPRDIKPTGATVQRFRNLRIAGEAILQFGDTRYGYYLDEIAVDVKTKKVKWNAGYPFEFLQLGESSEKPNKNPTMSDIEATLAAVEPVVAREVVAPPTVPVAAPKAVIGNAWKATYAPLPDGPAWFMTRLACKVEDHDGKRPAKEHFYGKVKIAGTFIKEDEDGNKIEYGRPIQSIDTLHPNWFGITWDNLEDLQPLPEPVIDTKDGHDYEVTELNKNRRIFYGDQLFQYTVAKPLAHSVKLMDKAKSKIKRKVI